MYTLCQLNTQSHAEGPTHAPQALRPSQLPAPRPDVHAEPEVGSAGAAPAKTFLPGRGPQGNSASSGLFPSHRRGLWATATPLPFSWSGFHIYP